MLSNAQEYKFRDMFCLHLYLLYHELPIMYNKEQELNVDKISIQSDNYQKFLPFIDAANGDDIEFRILKNVLIDAIQIGLDKLKSSNSQDRDNDNSTAYSYHYYDSCFKPSKNCIRTVPGTSLIVNVLPVLLSRTLLYLNTFNCNYRKYCLN